MFFHLHNHSEYSIGDGLHSPKTWVKAIKEAGFPAHALTDHGSMAGCLKFYKEMRAEKLHPILGCEFYFVEDPLDHSKEAAKSSHLVLLAKTFDGWLNLLSLQNLAGGEGFYYRPRIGWKWLEKHRGDLVCLTACLGGILGRPLLDDDPKLFNSRLRKLKKLFGDDLYIEIQAHDSDLQRQVNLALVGAGHKLIATNDCHYISPEHYRVQELVKFDAYRNKEKAESSGEFDKCYLASPGEIYTWFQKNHKALPRKLIVEAMRSTEEVLEKCRDFRLPEGKRYLPAFKCSDSRKVFTALVKKKLAEFIRAWKSGGLWSAMGNEKRREYLERFAKEYKVITKYNLEDYFLIVWDIVEYAKRNGIYVGLGRGSSAGSLISYLLGIVKVDPIHYKLLFERFLNENRCETGELPDIDLDFESDRRNEIKEYIFEKYGRDKVCEIGSYGRLKLKSSIIGFGKSFGINHYELLKITTKLDLDKDDAQSLEAAMAESRELKEIMEDRPALAFAVREVNGQVKSQSIHPAGVVISSEPIHMVTPVKSQALRDAERIRREGKRIQVTQCEDKDVIGQGLVKMDVLGIKEYDIFKYIVENSGCGMTVDNYVDIIHKKELSSPDEKVWEFFRTGMGQGIFQFGSAGMRELLRMMEADCLDDLIAAVALYRPGCLANNWHIQYCNRKSGEETVEFIHEDLGEALDETYGVIVYQEQFMKVFHTIGGISLSDADTIRSALGKKDKEKLEKFKGRFVEGASRKLGDMQSAEDLWDQVEKAAGYTFNKAHATVYAIVAYISQWFKVHFSNHFWAAVLSWDAKKGKWDDLARNKKAAMEMGVLVHLPDINRSGIDCGAATDGVLWSLCSVKSVGMKTVEEILAKRPFNDLDHFYKTVHKSKVKFNCMLALAYSGAFDCFCDRREAIRTLYALKGAKDKPCPDLTDGHMIFKFYEYLGFFEEKLKTTFAFESGLCEENDLRDMIPGELVAVGGMVADYKTMRTRKGDKMGKVTLVDLDERIELTLFPTQWAMYGTRIREGNLLQVIGKKSAYGGRENLVDVDEIDLIS